jgi:hypothetical protein
VGKRAVHRLWVVVPIVGLALLTGWKWSIASGLIR